MGLYQKLEGKWYSVLDRLDKHLPVYKLIDPIDKAVPSFLLFVVLALVLVGGVFWISQGDAPGQSKLKLLFEVQDSEGNALEGVEVKFSFAGKEVEKETDENGRIELTGLNEGEEVSVRVEETSEFKGYRGMHEAGEEETIPIRLLLKAPEFFSKEIYFKEDETGQLITGKEIYIRVGCSNTETELDIVSYTDSDKDGVIEVNGIPSACGTLVVESVRVDGFNSANAAINSDPGEVRLEAISSSAAMGTLVVTVEDAEGNQVNDVFVELKKWGETFDAGSTSGGEVRLEAEATGSYTIEAEDPLLKYASKTLENVRLYEGTETFETIVLSKSVKGIITVSVVDSITGEGIENARAELYYKDSGTLVAGKNTGESAEDVVFSVEDDKEMVLYASAEGFKPDQLAFSLPSGYAFPKEIGKEIELEQCTSSNCGIVEVTVEDEDGKRVENARVYLRNADGSIVKGVPARVTDSNGFARWTGMEEKTVYAYAEKFPANGSSAKKQVELAEVTQLEVNMTIGYASLEISTVDRDGQAIFGSTVEIFDASGKEDSMIYPLEGGELEQQVKADKGVYLVARHDNYASYQTRVYQLYPDETFEIEIEMVEERVSGTIEVRDQAIEFFNQNGRKVSSLQNGGIYQALIKVVIPEGVDYRQAGIHFRTGQSSHLANDFLYIKRVNVGNASVLKGTTFNLNNEERDKAEENLSAGDAKWANAVFIQPSAGVIEAGFTVKIDGKATPGSKLEVHFRAWGKLQNGSYDRHPFDSELGYNEFSGEKQALYAKTFDPEYIEGEEADCSPSNICLSNEILFDEQEEINLSKPFRPKAGGNYTYSFKLTNNSETRYENPELMIEQVSGSGSKRENLEISHYNINGFESDQAMYEVPRIDLGLFSKNAYIEGEFSFNAKEMGASYFNSRIISEANEVYDKEVHLNVVSDDSLELLIEPEEIASRIEVEVNAEVLDDEEDPVNGTRILVYRKNPSGVKTLLLGGSEEIKTQPNGRISFTVPASSPGSTIYFRAEKFGFESAEVEKEVDSKVLEIEPEELTVSLSSRQGGLREAKEEIDLYNKLNEDLKIREIKLHGRQDLLNYYFDIATMQNYYSQFIGTELPAKGHLPLGTKLFYAKLMQGVSEENIRIDANLSIVVEDELGNAWQFSVPSTIVIGAGAELENYDCLVVSLHQWTSVAQEATIHSPAFDIKNLCRDQETGQLVEVKNLKARLAWAGPAIGKVSATIGDWGTELNPGQAETFASSIGAGEILSGFLSFEPESETLEIDKRFEVQIEAEIETASGTKTVYSEPEAIKALVGNINLSDCLKVYEGNNDNTLVFEGDSIGEFQVDATNCGVGSGGIEIEVAFCRNDPGCAGSAGGVDLGDGLELLVDQTQGYWKVKLDDANPSKSIEVERAGYPGIYGVKVQARTTGRPAWEEIKTFDVIAKPSSDQFFSLKSYELVMPRSGDRDAVTLKNTELSDTYSVKASVCSWETAENSYWDNVKNAGIGSVGAGAAYLYAVKSLEALAFSGPWFAVALGVGLVIGALFGEDECDPTSIQSLPDYIINLSGKGPGSISEELKRDSQDILLETPAAIDMVTRGDNPIGWNFDDIEIIGGFDEERVGIEFENTGEESLDPLYGVITVPATRHMRNKGESGVDLTIKHKEEKVGTAFDMFNLRIPYLHSTTEYTQKFHLRFITKQEKIELPPLDQDDYDCFSPVGGITGRTGEKALPNIKLDWSFENGHVDWDSCNEETGFYCDATQFSIEVWKRIAKFNDFMISNGYNLSCPRNGGAEIAENAVGEPRTIEAGKIGVSLLSYSFGNGTATVRAGIQNYAELVETATLIVNLTVPATLDYDGETSCSTDLEFELGETNKTVSCEFTGLPESESFYSASSLLTGVDAEKVQSGAPYILFLAAETDSTSCWQPPSTAMSAGEFPLDIYLNKLDEDFGDYVTQGSINWNGRSVATDNQEIEEIVRELEELMHFNALLIKDGYSADFQQDFTKYYKEKAFFEVPEFSFDSDDSTKAMDEIGKYFNGTGVFNFSTKHIGSNQLPDAGLYRADIEINYIGESWRLFNSEGNPNAEITVKLERLEGPEKNNSFYYMPFNGPVGEENGVLKRNGYGIGFEGSKIRVSESPTWVETWKQQEQAPLVNAKVETIEDLRSLNSELASRGSLLTIKGDQFNKELEWSASFATPVGLKVSKGKTSEEFVVAYSLRKGSEGVLAGDSLAYWNGMGRCVDFGGGDVRTVFYYKGDRRAESNETRNWAFAYLNSWGSVAHGGNVFLKTLLFTPVGGSMTLKAEEPESLKFFTPNSGEKGFAGIEGVSGMLHNNKEDYVQSIQDLMDLVRERKVCITALDDGTKMKFYWNEAALWREEGITGSLNSFEASNLAVQGENCIAPN